MHKPTGEKKGLQPERGSVGLRERERVRRRCSQHEAVRAERERRRRCSQHEAVRAEREREEEEMQPA